MSKRFQLIFFTWLAVFGVVLPSSADFQPGDWPYRKRIAAPSLTQEQYVTTSVDNEIFDKARFDLGDLRLIEEDGQELPYKLVVEQREIKETVYSPNIFNQGFIPRSHSVFYLDLGQRGLLQNRLTIETPSVNFRRLVTIEGSDDQRTWYKLKTKGDIFDFSEGYHARYTTLDYPENGYRYLKITIWGESEMPLIIAGVKVYSRIAREPKKEVVAATILERNENLQRRATELDLDLGHRGVPTSRVEILTDEKNFRRQVEVATSDDRKTWIPVGSGHIFGYVTPKFTRADPHVSFQEAARRYLRITIVNYDDRPLQISGVKVYGIPRKLVFKYKPGGQYFLYYGNGDAVSPRYDIEQLLPYLALKHPPVVELGREEGNPRYVKKKVQRPWTEERPYLLWGALGLVVSVLGALSLRLIRQVGKGE